MFVYSDKLYSSVMGEINNTGDISAVEVSEPQSAFLNNMNIKEIENPKADISDDIFDLFVCEYRR